MTEFWVSFILKFSPSNWETCEKCQNFNHHKIVGANQSCPKLPPSKVTSVGWGTWIFIYQMGKD